LGTFIAPPYLNIPDLTARFLQFTGALGFDRSCRSTPMFCG